MRAALSLTHRCNLSCAYCYSGRATKRDMTLATAQRAVDIVMDATPSGQAAEISFFGGEPLLRFDLIEQIVAYARLRGQETGVRTSYSITSNGTLLTDHMLEYIGAEGIDLCISIDGPQDVHNRHRLHADGRGSFTEVVAKLLTAASCLDGLQVNAVYGPDTVAFLPRTVSFLADLGVSAIHLNPDIRAIWTEDSLARLLEAFLEVARLYVHSYEQGRELALNTIDTKMVLFVKGGYAPEDLCGMGVTEWGVAPSGNIYPCERLIGEDSDSALCLGNVHTGYDLAARCALPHRHENRREQCKTCELSRYCMTWCGCTNYFLTGDPRLPSATTCAIEKATLLSARYAFVSLWELNRELLVDHLQRYQSEECHRRL
jgi:uncharacterized protein